MPIASYTHTIATVLGFICAIVCAALMLNLKTDEQRLKRARIARRIAPVTWVAFIALIISGIFLALDKNDLNVYVLGAKHLLVLILLVDALLIHFRYFPRFFKQIGSPEFAKTYTVMRRIGALSVSCWIIILVLSVLLDRLT
ncbi:MAG: hypothetical protein WC169_09065 [Dehalococcoidia bacterium]|jgi:uncharacterized membrane protein